MATQWHVDPFSLEASTRKIKDETMAKLREHHYDSTETLASITDEEVERLGLPLVQKAVLMNWVREVRRASEPSMGSNIGLQTQIVRRKTTMEDLPRRAQTPDPSLGGRDNKDNSVKDGFLKVIGVKKRSKSAERQQQMGDDLIELRVNDLCDIIDESVLHFMDSEVSIAVCGRSGTGKSSLINCILNMKAKEHGAANVGIVECTTDPVAYKHPDIPGVLIWDLPGVGTDRYDTASYLTTVEFSRFDAYIIVCSNRIYQDDTWLAAEAEEQSKPFYFVRSKIDQDVSNAMRDNDMDEATALLTIRENAKDSLVKSGVGDNKIYLVSSVIRYQSKWDFSLLMEELIKRTPSKNVTAMIMAMVSCSTEIIAKKKQDFFKRINAVALEAAKPANSYKHVILAEIKLYEERFGVTDADLRKWEVEVDKLEPKLQGIKLGLVSLIQSLDKEKVKHFLWKLATHPFFDKFEWAKRLAKKTDRKFIVIGAAATSKAQQESTDLIKETTRQTLETALDHCAVLALGVLEQRNKVTLPSNPF